MPLLVRGGTVRADGTVLSAAEVARRVGWLVGLTRTSAASLLERLWDEPGLATLADGMDACGRRLPAAAWMAARRLGWAAPVPYGVYLPDRVRRCAQEETVRLLRSALYRRAVLSVVLSAWPVADGGKLSPSGRRGRAGWDAPRREPPG